MFKKTIFNNLTPKYNNHAYSGLMGFFYFRDFTQIKTDMFYALMCLR